MDKRTGNQEPSKKVIAAYAATDGVEASDLYELTGRTALDWQKNIINHILAKNSDGLWTHTRFGYSVPRQNGKGEILVMREIYALAIGERVLHTAHLVATAHKAFERLEMLLDKLGVDFKSIKAKGQELIEIKEGGRVEFRTRTAKGGLGESYDLVIIDEAQEYQMEQETALLYVISASPNPQIIMTGTPPTPVSSGTVFRDYRDSVLAGQKPECGWAEWSVDEFSDVNDRDLWYLANPSLGVRLTERTIEGEIGSSLEKRTDFNIQRLGLWMRENLQSVITSQDWNQLLVKKVPEKVGKLNIGIKYEKSGDSVSMAIAYRTAENKVFFEVIGRHLVRDGTDWIIKFLEKAKGNYNKVVIDGKNGQKILEDEMKSHKLKGAILPMVSEVINANAVFEKGLFEKTICRMEQASLTQVATNCEKRAIGSNGGFGYQALYADMDISLLDAVILAVWAVWEYPEPKKQRISY